MSVVTSSSVSRFPLWAKILGGIVLFLLFLGLCGASLWAISQVSKLFLPSSAPITTPAAPASSGGSAATATPVAQQPTPAPQGNAAPSSSNNSSVQQSVGPVVYALPVLEAMQLQAFPATWSGLAPHSKIYGMQFQPPTIGHECKSIVSPADPMEYPSCLFQLVQGGTDAFVVYPQMQQLAAKFNTPSFEGESVTFPGWQAVIGWCPGSAVEYPDNTSRPLEGMAGAQWMNQLFLVSAGGADAPPNTLTALSGTCQVLFIY